MQLITEPQVWLSFLALTALELVLGIDNILVLSLLVGRLAEARRRRARLVGLGFAMLTRLALLFSVVWLIGLRRPLFSLASVTFSAGDVILLGGGLFVIANSALELREMAVGVRRKTPADPSRGVALTVLQIGLLDIVFSLDSVFTAIGLARRVEVMAAAIVASVLLMMWMSGGILRFIEQRPAVKVLALTFLAAVGAALVAEALHRPIPEGYLYVAMGFAAVVEVINARLRRPPRV
jgi:predicted tellurium resistance membrane protein TerC